MIEVVKGLDLTTQQTEFVLAITNALTKYSSEGSGFSGHNATTENDAFLNATDSLISETVRLDYALRTVGSGGPGMYQARVFRNHLRDLKGLLSGSSSKRDWSKILSVIQETSGITIDLKNTLKDFMNITFNEKLMNSLDKLRSTLEMHSRNGQSHVHDESTTQLKRDLASSFFLLQTHLAKYVEEDICNIKSVQNDAIQGYVNLTVIATFLSGVTASVIQLVGPTTSGNSVLEVTVNASLFSSLIFSTASAAQSLLVMSWTQSFVRLPEMNLPRLLYAWLRRGPLISLLVSGALFAVGLIVFVFSSRQDPVTSVITTCFATMQTLGVLSLTILFIRDRWNFRQNCDLTGQKLTNSSILFSLMEAMRRVILYMFCSSRPSQNNGHSPTDGPAGSSFRLNVSEWNDESNYGSMPSPLYFQTHAKASNSQPFAPNIPPEFGYVSPIAPANGMVPDEKQDHITSRNSDRTEVVSHLAPQTQHNILEVQHFAPSAVRSHTDDYGGSNSLPPLAVQMANLKFQQMSQSHSVQEMQHFNHDPGNIGGSNNERTLFSGFPPPVAMTSVTDREILHFGKENSDNRVNRVAVPATSLFGSSLFGSENPVPMPSPPPPAQSASLKEIKHFKAHKLDTNKSDYRPLTGNPDGLFGLHRLSDDPNGPRTSSRSSLFGDGTPNPPVVVESGEREM